MAVSCAYASLPKDFLWRISDPTSLKNAQLLPPATRNIPTAGWSSNNHRVMRSYRQCFAIFKMCGATYLQLSVSTDSNAKCFENGESKVSFTCPISLCDLHSVSLARGATELRIMTLSVTNNIKTRHSI